MTTPVEKRNASKFYEFHREVGHTTDECMHLKRKIEEMLKARKLIDLIKELKQNHRKDQEKKAKKDKTSRKDKPLAILMVQPWQKIARQRITQTFSSESIISFPTLGEEDGMEGPMIIEAEMGGHCMHRMYVDEGSSSEILYEHCFSKFHPEIKNQLIPANTPLVKFSGEIIWPLGQISLLVKIGDEEHSTVEPIAMVCSGYSKWIATWIFSFVTWLMTGHGTPEEGDLTTMKFIQADVECSSSPIFTSNDEGPPMNFQCQTMNQDSYNSNSLGFDQPQPPHNLEYRDEIKIAELTETFNSMSIEIRKKEKLQQLEQWAYLSTHPSKCFNSFRYDDDDDDEDYTIAVTPSLSIE
nr:reverse transcriptase domain-containing protein [Tanacetum cinerariifolium]